MKSLLAVVVMALGLSACTTTLGVRDAEIRTRDATIRVSDGDYHHHDGYGTFCPPGQAKKGRC
ncbi:hypothetical protein [Zobellella aerophila]|uniref:Lipoprotein n=1 Tax=Zobellella aerophila TaxID=870480 RepID=A0ABP6W8E7_9GAMM